MRTIQSLRLDGLLSFAPGSPAFDLGALNVLIPGNSPIADWLQQYQLGDLWRMGELGANP